MAAFDKIFANLKTARDALVHSDERILGQIRGQRLGAKVKDIQFISLRGTRLTAINEAGQDFIFDFRPKYFMITLDKLKEILES